MAIEGCFAIREHSMDTQHGTSAPNYLIYTEYVRKPICDQISSKQDENYGKMDSITEDDLSTLYLV